MDVYAGKRFCEQYPALRRAGRLEAVVMDYVKHLRTGGEIKRDGKVTHIRPGRIKDTERKHGIRELWKYNITGNYRMAYAHFEPGWECGIKQHKKEDVPEILGCNLEWDGEKDRIVLYWIGDHDNYDRWREHGKHRKESGGKGRPGKKRSGAALPGRMIPRKRRA